MNLFCHKIMILISVLLIAAKTLSFYVPGVTPKDYKKGERVDLHVNALSSLRKSVCYLAASLKADFVLFYLADTL